MVEVAVAAQGADSSMQVVVDYHARTRHQFSAYAKGPETLDWDNQPNPFRSFDGTDKISMSLDALLSGAPASELSLNSLSQFLRYALGLTAWKTYGPDSWSLRVNPSSGNLHPTEAYLLLPSSLGEVTAGLYHYNAQWHQLEKRAELSSSESTEKGFYVVLTSVLWRESWKYGERSFRYSQLDVGHAIGTLSHSAQLLDWQLHWLPQWSPEQLESWLGLEREEYAGVEKECAEAAFYIQLDADQSDDQLFAEHCQRLSNWSGKPSLLCEEPGPYRWPWVDRVAKATATVESPKSKIAIQVPAIADIDHQSILRRRSAQRFDGKGITLDQFGSLINSLGVEHQSLLQGGQKFSFSALITVHDVQGLQPGFYILSSNQQLPLLRSRALRWQEWQQITDVDLSANSSLWLLTEANVRKAAATLCCQQSIASDCAFGVGFLTDMDLLGAANEPIGYRHIFWQAGLMCQQLYVQSSALGLATTGIGCFFDEPWEQMLGIEENSLQFLYHAAVGHPIVDERITTVSGYHTIKDRIIL